MDSEVQTENSSQIETHLAGLAVSRGTAIGRVTFLHGDLNQFFKTTIDPDDLSGELDRMNAAFVRANDQLEHLLSGPQKGNARSGIFDAHLMVLNDPSFRSRIEETISAELINAEWAVASVAAGYVSRLRALDDRHLRERYIDVADVAERLLSAFSRRQLTDHGFEQGSVLAASEIRPSTLVELENSRPGACISEHGGWTSHTYILARELGIPAVTGVKGLSRQVKTGDMVIVDGYHGIVIAHPQESTLENYRQQTPRRARARSTKPAARKEITTLDGKHIHLSVNAENRDHVDLAAAYGAKGVGLFRSESLFSRFNGFPSEDIQFESYCSIAERAGSYGAKIRTFDLSIGQTSPLSAQREKNPALGLRGLRFALHEKTEFTVQIRALLRAAARHSIGILLPMVDGVSAVREAKAVIDQVRTDLANEGVPVGEPEIGAMIEVPAAVFEIRPIAEEVDFMCLGTNDLVQYILAVDRDNEAVADWFRSLHPAVVGAIGDVCRAAEKSGKQMIVCGEMAGSPYYTPLLIGVGATALSMNVNSLPQIATLVQNIAYEEAHAMVASLSECRTANEIEDEIKRFIDLKWSHLYPEGFFGRDLPMTKDERSAAR